jgi:hypothetical protein
MIEFLKLVFHAPVEKKETWSDWWVKVAPTAEHISPILEAVLWVAIIVYLTKKFRKPLSSLFGALEKRIQDGAGFKAFQFELGATVQTAAEQSSALDREIAGDPEGEQLGAGEEIPGDASETGSHSSSDKEAEDIVDVSSDEIEKHEISTEENAGKVAAAGALGSISRLVSESHLQHDYLPYISHLLAEDLAMRAIQSEFEATIQRQAKFSRDLLVDGWMQTENVNYLIEVKFFSRAPKLSVLSSVLWDLNFRISAIESLFPKRRNTGIFALVLESENDRESAELAMQKVKSRIEPRALVSGGPTLFRIYTLERLLEDFRTTGKS